MCEKRGSSYDPLGPTSRAGGVGRLLFRMPEEIRAGFVPTTGSIPLALSNMDLSSRLLVFYGLSLLVIR